MDALVKERLLRFLGERSLRAVAIRSGIEPSKLHRQLSNELKVQTVVQICRAYDAPMLTAFALVGFITEEEGNSLAIDAALKQASSRQIAEEILRRSIEDTAAEAASAEPESAIHDIAPAADAASHDDAGTIPAAVTVAPVMTLRTHRKREGGGSGLTPPVPGRAQAM